MLLRKYSREKSTHFVSYISYRPILFLYLYGVFVGFNKLKLAKHDFLNSAPFFKQKKN